MANFIFKGKYLIEQTALKKQDQGPMANFICKGKYRADRGHQHGTPREIEYSEKFNWNTDVVPMQKQVRHFVEKRLKSKDADFDSIKTLTITKA